MTVLIIWVLGFCAIAVAGAYRWRKYPQQQHATVQMAISVAILYTLATSIVMAVHK